MKSPLHERPLITEDHEVGRSGLSVSSKGTCEDMAHQGEPDDPGGNAERWFQVPSKFRTSSDPLPQPWEDRFGPLRRSAVDHLMVVGQIGQSIDGRIATVTGHSKYINGPAGLAHLHRLRALVDAVLVGIGTAGADRARSEGAAVAERPGIGRRWPPPPRHHGRGRAAEVWLGR